jgi:hypothetical protein
MSDKVTTAVRALLDELEAVPSAAVKDETSAYPNTPMAQGPLEVAANSVISFIVKPFRRSGSPTSRTLSTSSICGSGARLCMKRWF